MSKLKVQVLHECQMPPVPMVIKKETITRKGWFGRTWTETVEKKVPEYDTMKFTCDCKAVWSFMSGHTDHGGFWMCDSRPQVWKEI